MKRKKLSMQKIGDALGISKALVSMNFAKTRNGRLPAIKKFIQEYRRTK